MTDIVQVPEAAPQSVLDALVGHSLTPGVVHTNLQADMCACSAQITAHRPQVTASSPDGGICFACGGFTVRTGSCTTCTSCGTSGGCG